MKREPKIIALDCPECGRVNKHDGDGCCACCGRDLCLVFENCRVYWGEEGRGGGHFSRAHWYRVVASVAAEYGTVTPALAQVCKTKRTGQASARKEGR